VNQLIDQDFALLIAECIPIESPLARQRFNARPVALDRSPKSSDFGPSLPKIPNSDKSGNGDLFELWNY
jgi:hypothetical protein